MTARRDHAARWRQRPLAFLSVQRIGEFRTGISAYGCHHRATSGKCSCKGPARPNRKNHRVFKKSDGLALDRSPSKKGETAGKVPRGQSKKSPWGFLPFSDRQSTAPAPASPAACLASRFARLQTTLADGASARGRHALRNVPAAAQSLEEMHSRPCNERRDRAHVNRPLRIAVLISAS